MHGIVFRECGGQHVRGLNPVAEPDAAGELFLPKREYSQPLVAVLGYTLQPCGQVQQVQAISVAVDRYRVLPVLICLHQRLQRGCPLVQARWPGVYTILGPTEIKLSVSHVDTFGDSRHGEL